MLAKLIVGLGAIAIVILFFILLSSSKSDEELTGSLTADPTSVAQVETIEAEVPIAQNQYQPFTRQAFAAASNKKRIIFFHAAWCPTCKQANVEFEAQSNALPVDVVLFKTDYDTETELKKKFDITYQHTFVEVDAAGEELQKWNGGGVAELTSRVQ